MIAECAEMEIIMNNFTDFEKVNPEAEGISSESLMNFLKRLENQDIAMHSAILMRHGKIVLETYYKPYDKNTLHRMFSITKSFVSLAIGLLQDEGKLSLNDKIVSFFPEKLPAEGVHPYIAQITIRDMLRMATAHDKTTFKTLKINDWVKTFFTVKPTHVPGTCFSYDTSSTHTLAALVEKLSGKELLDYLRFKFLDELDFSKHAYCMKDPVGVSMGGSGLMATPYDLLKVMYVISQDGKYHGKQLLPKEYLKAATTKQIDNYGKGPTFEEMQGYGYQFWCTRNNGIVCYGMGGQLALYLPDEDIILITTAYTNERQGGVQLIYDAFWEEVYQKLSESTKTPMSYEDSMLLDMAALDGASTTGTAGESAKNLLDFEKSRNLITIQGLACDTCEDEINGKQYALDENPMGFQEISLHFFEKRGANHRKGALTYKNKSGIHTLEFGESVNIVQLFPDYNCKTAVSGGWRSSDTFLIKAHIIDECVGCVYIQLVFKADTVTVMMRKFEETSFNEFDGFVSGHLI